LAVLAQSLAFVIMAQWFKLGGGVVHPLTRRYAFYHYSSNNRQFSLDLG